MASFRPYFFVFISLLSVSPGYKLYFRKRFNSAIKKKIYLSKEKIIS